MIKKHLTTLSVALFMLVPAFGMVSVGSASAIDLFGNVCVKGSTASTTDVCQEQALRTTNPVVHAITIGIDILSAIVGVAAVIVIILSSFKMIRSNGNSQEVSDARTGIIYAAIGLVIAVIAPLIVGYVLTKLQ